MSTDDPRIAKREVEANAESANAILREQQILELTDRDMDALLAAIASPPAPNAALLRSVERWRKSIAANSAEMRSEAQGTPPSPSAGEHI